MPSAALPLLALMLAAAPARPPRPEGTRLEQGQRLFTQGDLEAALKLLDAAVTDGGDDATLARIHLLRAQCLAARQDFTRAEDAFALALDANPEASLDPAKVDPTVVKLLESVRARLPGTVLVESAPSGAALILDGRDAGAAPQTLSLPAGLHRLAARWGEGPTQPLELLVRPRREVRVAWVQAPAPPLPSSPSLLTPRPLRPFGELRGSFEPATSGALYGTLDVGGGVELGWLRLALFARLLQHFGVVPRVQLSLPVLQALSVVLEAGVPMTFLPTGFGLGLQGGGGAEYTPVPWFGVYALVGGRHHLLWPQRNDATAFTATVGLRLRVP